MSSPARLNGEELTSNRNIQYYRRILAQP